VCGAGFKPASRPGRVVVGWVRLAGSAAPRLFIRACRLVLLMG